MLGLDVGYGAKQKEANKEEFFTNLKTTDIEGNDDITLINVWGTFCSPCIAKCLNYRNCQRNTKEEV